MKHANIYKYIIYPVFVLYVYTKVTERVGDPQNVHNLWKVPKRFKYEACAFNQSAMHIKLSMICCFGSCAIVLFTGHFKGF